MQIHQPYIGLGFNALTFHFILFLFHLFTSVKANNKHTNIKSAKM